MGYASSEFTTLKGDYGVVSLSDIRKCPKLKPCSKRLICWPLRSCGTRSPNVPVNPAGPIIPVAPFILAGQIGPACPIRPAEPFGLSGQCLSCTLVGLVGSVSQVIPVVQEDCVVLPTLTHQYQRLILAFAYILKNGVVLFVQRLQILLKFFTNCHPDFLRVSSGLLSCLLSFPPP